MTMNPPPPGPATNGIVTPSALAVATAASTALPPCLSALIPAWLAPRSMEATPPPVPTATGCLAPLLPPPPCPAALAALNCAGTVISRADRADREPITPQRRRRRIENLFVRKCRIHTVVPPRELSRGARPGPC